VIDLLSAQSPGALPCFIFRYSEFRNIPSIHCELAPCLGFIGEELGILRRGEKGPLCIVGLAKRTGRIRCLNCTSGRFLSATSAAGKTLVFATLSNFNGGAIHFYNGGQVGW
jgi:hypothetical protein